MDNGYEIKVLFDATKEELITINSYGSCAMAAFENAVSFGYIELPRGLKFNIFCRTMYGTMIKFDVEQGW